MYGFGLVPDPEKRCSGTVVSHHLMRALSLALIVTALAAPLLKGSPAFDHALVLFRQHRFAEAKSAFEAAAAAADPRNLEAQAYIGRCLLELRQPDAAVKIFEKLAAAAPPRSEAFRELGDAYGSKAEQAGAGLSGFSNARKARAAWLRAIALDPANVEAHSHLLQYYIEAPSIVGGGMDKAYAEMAKIQKLDTLRGAEAAELVYAADHKPAEAMAALAAILLAKPGDYGANYRFGRLAAMSGRRLDEGWAALTRCLGRPPSPGAPGYAAVHWLRGVIRDQQGNRAGAREEYGAALVADPKFAPALDAMKRADATGG
jgi:tetratricopeptide (TPR) repeat protein